MSNHYIGLDLFDLENNGLRQPISRITLYRGDNAALTAGDDTGLEVVADCIYVTKEMVEALLSAARGYQYHAYSAQAARLNPAAELGDTVEVGSIVSVLAQISDNGDLYPDIAAPGDREVEDEYPAAGPLTQALTKAFDKKLATARSEITKTTDKIAFAIFGEDGKGGLNGRMNTFTMGLSGISNEIKGYKDTVTGYEEQLALYKQDLDGYSGEVSKYTKEVNGYKEQTISYKGSVDGFEQRVALYQEQAGKTQEAYSLISQKVNNIKLEVTNNDDTASIQLVVDGKNQGAPAKIEMTGLVTFTDLKTSGSTTIHGGNITTGKIAAERLSLTEAITWSDLSSGCKEKIGDGLTEDDVTTYIDSSLVSSPTIKGGKFRDLNDVAQLRLTYDDDSKIPTLVYSELGLGGRKNMFAISPFKANSEWIGLVLGGQAIMMGYNGSVQVYGDWDFSGANVTFDPDKVSGL